MCNLIISFLFRKQSFYAYYDTKKSICPDYFCLMLVIFCEIHPFFIYQFVFSKNVLFVSVSVSRIQRLKNCVERSPVSGTEEAKFCGHPERNDLPQTAPLFPSTMSGVISSANRAAATGGCFSLVRVPKTVNALLQLRAAWNFLVIPGLHSPPGRVQLLCTQ